MRRLSMVVCVVVAGALGGAPGAFAQGAARTNSGGQSATLTPATLNGVSCTSVSACTAVGGSGNSANGTLLTLAERWDGTSWTVQSTRNPEGTNFNLAGVACTSSDACTAVGSYTNAQGTSATLVERWNGGSWTIQSAPVPSGAQGAALTGVSCTSASACTAVGDYFTGAAFPALEEATLAERWNGTHWTVEPTPLPSNPDADGATLGGVSCTSANECSAIGYYVTIETNAVTIADRWNGNSWTMHPAPVSPFLSAVSCSGARSCAVVGGTIDNGICSCLLADGWNGDTWTAPSPPYPDNNGNGTFYGVSCTATDACTAVGNSLGPLAERWDGNTWTIQPTPVPVGSTRNSSLNGVSCTSARACIAVGTNVTGSSNVTLAEQWNGTNWTIQPTP